MVRVPTPADPTTGLSGDPRMLMRTLLGLPRPRTDYERKQIDDALARACMEVLTRMEALEERVRVLEQSQPRPAKKRKKKAAKKRRSASTESAVSGGTASERPAVDPRSVAGSVSDSGPTDPTRGNLDAGPAPAASVGTPGTNQGGSTYTPKPGSLRAHLLSVLVEDGGPWTVVELIDELERRGLGCTHEPLYVRQALAVMQKHGLVGSETAPPTGKPGRRPLVWKAVVA